MKAPCGLEDCDCGHTIEALVTALEGFREEDSGHFVGCIINRLSGEDIVDLEATCNLRCARAREAIAQAKP